MAMVLVPRRRKVKRRRAAPVFAQAGPRLPPQLRGRVRYGGYYGRLRGRAAAAGSELKFFDTSTQNTTSLIAGVIASASVNLIPQGVTESTRVGRKCVLKRISFKGTLRNDESTTLAGTDNNMRIIVYLDQQCNGATAIPADILENVGANNTGFDSHYNLSNSGRFKILYDIRKNMIVPAVAQTAAGTFSSYRSTYVWSWGKACNIPVEFSDVTGAITEIRSNNVGVLIICNENDNQPTISYTCRVRFSDG